MISRGNEYENTKCFETDREFQRELEELFRELEDSRQESLEEELKSFLDE